MNAIKLTFVSKLFLMLMLSGIAQFAYAQHGPVCKDRSTIISICEGNNWGFIAGDNSNEPAATTACGDLYINAYAEEGCESGYIPITIYCTNIPGDPNSDGYYQWPEGMPDLFIEYDYDDNTVAYTPAIIKWEYAGEIEGTDHLRFAAQTTIYSAHLTGDFCPKPIPINHFSFTTRVKLVTDDGPNNYETYPIEDYATPDGIFSCEIFEETCYLCDNDLDFTCKHLLVPEYPIDICMECADCNALPTPKFDNHHSREELVLTDKSLQVKPNPFNDQFQYSFHYEAPTAFGQASIFNAQGQMIWSEGITIKNGNNIYQTNALDIPTGLYFLQIKTPRGNQVTQIVKLD